MDAYTATLPENGLPVITDRVAQFNKRAAKRGLPAVTLTVGEPIISTHRSPLGGTYETREYPVTLDAPVLALGDYTLVARVSGLDRNGTLEPFVTTAPGQSLPATYAVTSITRCDHCQKQRPRRETFIVRAQDGTHVQLGRQCIRDFLGYDPEALIAYWEGIDGISQDEDGLSFPGGGGGPRYYQPDEVLRATSAIVARFGWVSRRTASETGQEATASKVKDLLNPPHGGEGLARWSKWADTIVFNEAAEGIYTHTLAAIADLTDKVNRRASTGEWEDNIVRLATADRLTGDRIALFASAVVMGWKRVNAPRTTTDPYVRHDAREGDKVTVEGTVIFHKIMESAWGATTLIKIETADPRRLFVWWATGGRTFDADARVRITGTVKRVQFDDYAKGEAATLTRCKIELL